MNERLNPGIMIVTIHQPEYVPWAGFFDRIDKSDVFVILDHVKYQKNGFINRNRVKTAQGATWVTIPVKGQHKTKNIDTVEIIDENDWQKKHWDKIKSCYINAPYFKQYAPVFEEIILKKNWKLISDLDCCLIEKVMEILGIKTKLVKSSSLSLASKGTDMNIDICKKVGADTFLLGPGYTEEGLQHHLDIEKIKQSGIKVMTQKFVEQEHLQNFKELGFIPYLSIMDLLFNCGDKSLEIIRSGSKQ